MDMARVRKMFKLQTRKLKRWPLIMLAVGIKWAAGFQVVFSDSDQKKLLFCCGPLSW